jgi:cyclomaltodextrinase / maltogenic alpha-amylase / neopullulanase
MKNRIFVIIVGLFYVSGSLLAHDGRTPLLTLDVGRTYDFSLADLALSAEAGVMEFSYDESSLTVELNALSNAVRITADKEFGYAIIESPAGDVFCRTSQKLEVDFSWSGPGNPEQVSVFGSFNGWNRGSHMMQKKPSTGFGMRLHLDPGTFEYLFSIDGKEIRDPANPDSAGNGFGGWNSIIKVQREKVAQPVLFRLGIEEGKVVFLLREKTGLAEWSAAEPTSKTKVTALLGNTKIDEAAMNWVGDVLFIDLGTDCNLLNPTTLRVGVSQNNVLSPLQTVFLGGDFCWQDAVVYALMPDRFNNGDTSNDSPVIHSDLEKAANWQGGDLAGIGQKIDSGYFKSLGTNALWIYPIGKSTTAAWQEYPEPHRWYTGYHGYWPIESKVIDSRFGTDGDFRDLIGKAHEENIRVMLDLVANHVHQEHPWVKQHPDWFTELELADGSKNLRRWDEYRLTTWFEPYMPDIDYENSEAALEAATDEAVWWLSEFDLDAFRHDAVKHVPRKFWNRLTQKIRKTYKKRDRIFQIGETFGSDELISSYVSPAALDAQFNFNLFHAARRIFLDENASFVDLASLLETNLEHYGRNNLMGNLMDSHDKTRYMAFADGDLILDVDDTAERAWNNQPDVTHVDSYDKIELYMSYLLTIPGVPFLYYGDEIGMTGSSDPDNRRMMRFDENLTPPEKELKENVSTLIWLRRLRPEFRRGDFNIVHADKKSIAWMRTAERSDGSISSSIVALNKTSQALVIKVHDPVSWKSQELKIKPYGYKVIHLQ